MKSSVTASAPGKLVLTGEYAVLDGATAVAAATDVRARVTVSPAASGEHELRIVNNGKCFRFSGGFDSEPQWCDDPADYGGILESLLAHLRRSCALSPAPVCIAIDTGGFYFAAEVGHTPVKTGIGSSGAVVVALTSALYRWLKLDADLETALEVHQSFQSGAGSGIDVVTSWHGGMIALTPGNPATVAPVHLPAGLTLRPVWTRESASTTVMLAQLQAFKDRHAGAYELLSAALCASAEAAAVAWRQDDPQLLLRAINDYSLSLRAFDDETGAGIWSPVHQDLAAIASQAGVVYKPSGAGGGDYGIAFAIDPERAHRFAALTAEAGYADAVPEWSEQGLLVSTD